MDTNRTNRPATGVLLVFVLALGVASGLQQLLLGAVARGNGALRSAMLSVSVSVVGLVLILVPRALRARESRLSGRELLTAAAIALPAAGYILEAGLGHAWYVYGAGLFGLLLVGGLAVSVPRLGTSVTISLVVAGQMAVSLLLDQLGLLGLARIHLSPLRALGGLLVLAGALLILRPRHA